MSNSSGGLLAQLNSTKPSTSTGTPTGTEGCPENLGQATNSNILVSQLGRLIELLQQELSLIFKEENQRDAKLVFDQRNLVALEELIAAVERNTQVLKAELDELTEAVTTRLESIVSTIDDGINVTAVQSGVWAVDVNNPTDINALAEQIRTELNNVPVQIAGQLADLSVEVVNDSITVTVDNLPEQTNYTDSLNTIITSLDRVEQAILANTATLKAEIDELQAAITPQLQGIIDTIDDGISVEATQAGTWTVTTDNPTDLQELADKVALALANQPIQIAGQDADVNVNVTNDSLEVVVSNFPTPVDYSIVLTEISTKLDNLQKLQNPLPVEIIPMVDVVSYTPYSLDLTPMIRDAFVSGNNLGDATNPNWERGTAAFAIDLDDNEYGITRSLLENGANLNANFVTTGSGFYDASLIFVNSYDTVDIANSVNSTTSKLAVSLDLRVDGELIPFNSSARVPYNGAQYLLVNIIPQQTNSPDIYPLDDGSIVLVPANSLSEQSPESIPFNRVVLKDADNNIITEDYSITMDAPYTVEGDVELLNEPVKVENLTTTIQSLIESNESKAQEIIDNNVATTQLILDALTALSEQSLRQVTVRRQYVSTQTFTDKKNIVITVKKGQVNIRTNGDSDILYGETGDAFQLYRTEPTNGTVRVSVVSGTDAQYLAEYAE